MATNLTYIGLASGLSDGRPPRLQVATPSGAIREIDLDRKQLLRIIKAAAGALEVLGSPAVDCTCKRLMFPHVRRDGYCLDE